MADKWLVENGCNSHIQTMVNPILIHRESEAWIKVIGLKRHKKRKTTGGDVCKINRLFAETPLLTKKEEPEKPTG